jgi:HPt (histidine-containing phosphotransfer) domain-containing protein
MILDGSSALTGGVGAGEFDLAAVLATFEQDEELVRELLALFVEDCPGRMAAIAAAVSAGDAAALRVAAHTLKGALSVFGPVRAVKTARDLEAIGLAGDLTRADAVVARLGTETTDLLDHFGEILSRR